MDSQQKSQPIRPPRLTRSSSKETSGGLLMSVIRTLTSSRDSSDRDREKANLEREFYECDRKLSQLVVSHHHDLSQVMSAFSKISQKLKLARERVVATREKLQTCTKLLHCKRDELKKLWIESVENKVILELLDRVENMMTVTLKVDNYIAKKHYLHATKLLVNSLLQLDTDLVNVDALKDVKTELIMKKESLYEIIIDELHKHLYIRSTADIIKKFKRQGSGRHTSDGMSSRKMSVADILSPALMQNAANSGSNRKPMTSYATQNDYDIDEDTDITDPEEDSKHFVTIIVECFVLLNKINEAIEAIKERCDRELANIIKRTARELVGENAHTSNVWPINNKLNMSYVLNSSMVLGIDENGQSRNAFVLKDFLELLFQQYRSVVRTHESMIAILMRRIDTQRNISSDDIHLYTIHDIWSKVQNILQFVADLYLDMSGLNSNEKALALTGNQNSSMPIVSNPAVYDLSVYFAKKKGITGNVGAMKLKKMPLFRFDCSSHAISLNAFLHEQKESIKEKSENGESPIDSVDLSLSHSEQYMVCHSAPENIVIMFNPMMKFIREIEEEMELDESNHCPLHSYIISCARMFCNQVNGELERMTEMANKSLDIWKVTADQEVLSTMGLSRPILHSTLMVDRGIHELKNLMFSLQLYSDDFLTLICNVLSNYKEICLASYRGIVQPEPEDKRIISATWAKDEDIKRFLKSLPNWETLKGAQAESKRNKPYKLLSQESRMTFDESPEEVRLRNMRESEILTSNLSQETMIPHHEILSDVAQLRILAQLQESMEWMGKRCDELANSLPQSSDNSFLSPQNFNSSSKSSADFAPLSDVSIATLNQLSQDFEELAETCLLVLHLEVRVHCFYYLLPMAQNSFAIGIDSQEPDPEVIRLNKNLVTIDEAMGVALQPWKLRYIFEGVGHLVATILINSANTIKRINSNGVKKMCRNIFAIQQSLTSITMNREVALDYARQYFELFYHTPEEILTTIIEKGPQFQLNEYVSAITLLHKSLTGREQHVLDSALKRLTDILNEVAVSL